MPVERCSWLCGEWLLMPFFNASALTKNSIRSKLKKTMNSSTDILLNNYWTLSKIPVFKKELRLLKSKKHEELKIIIEEWRIILIIIRQKHAVDFYFYDDKLKFSTYYQILLDWENMYFFTSFMLSVVLNSKFQINFLDFTLVKNNYKQ